ncbi:12901_t:CDS:2, partial [Racocetra persica]
SNDDKFFYARTLWQINPLLNLTAPDEKVVCELTVTDCKSFWTTTLTISDLKQIKPSGIPDVSKFCGATQAALSGQEEYDSYKLSCRISVSEKHARTKSVAIETRLSDLETIRGRMQERIEIMVAEKVNHEAILMEKFKQILNAKKKKIKKLTKALNTNGKIIPSQQVDSVVLSDGEFTDEPDPNSNLIDEEAEVDRFKKPRLDNNVEQMEDDESVNNKQPDESLLTKTFRGTVIKSRRMGKKPANVSKDTTSIDQFLDPRKNPNITSQDPLQEAGSDSDAANDLLSRM